MDNQVKILRRRPLGRRLEKFKRKGWFFQIFTEPKTFSDETIAVIRFFLTFCKSCHIDFVETKGFDYKVDLQNQIIYGPRPLTERELLVFLYYVVYLMIRDANTFTANWLVPEFLRSYVSPDPVKLGYEKIKFKSQFK